MDFKIIIWLIIVLSLITSIGFVSAFDMNDTTMDFITHSDEIDLNDSDKEDNLEIAQENQIDSQEENSRVIYLGQNKTTDGGNGTIENPFNSFELACNNLSGENKVEINVYNGTYYLDSDLKFNTNNLIITGIGEVTIKNLRNEPGTCASFGLTSTNGNFTFNNLIFDASNCNELSLLSEKPHFNVFRGLANQGEFYNCTFTGFSDAAMFRDDFSKKFLYCNFINTTSKFFFYYTFRNPKVTMEFDYCIFSCSYEHFCDNRVYLDENNNGPTIIFNNVWFGSNMLPGYLSIGAYDNNGYNVGFQGLSINRYAKFSVFEKYLGNDTFEINGGLTWNDGSSDGLDKLSQMIVQISSKTGEINKTAILENGTFKSIYKSKSRDNHIEVELDFEDVILEFKNDIQVIAPPINYGDEQIFTISLPQTNNNITLTINNKTYNISSNGLSTFNFTVPDELLAGEYQIDVKIMDENNHVYGMNSTKWNISKINKNMIVSTPADAYINDDSITIGILLANDASGNITIIVGDKNITKECSGKNTQINIAPLLNAGENNIEVIYSGDKKYSSQINEEKIFINKVFPDINITKPINPTITEEINITINIPQFASGNIIIAVGDKNITLNNISNNNTVNIADLLNVGYNNVLIKYSGDEFWNSQIKKETIIVSKLSPNMSISLPNIINVEENIFVNVTLPNKATGNLSVKMDDKTHIFNIGDIINISSSFSGKNTINVTYNGDDNYFSQSIIVNITVEKNNISSQNSIIEVINHTNPIFTVKLANDITTNLTIAIKDTKYSLEVINGTGTLKVNDLYPGDYIAVVYFDGNYKYGSFVVNLNFNVPKPILKANDMNTIYCSGAKFYVQVIASDNPVIGKDITLTINGKKITAITDSKGYAGVKIDLAPKSTKYAITAEYQGVIITNHIKVNSIIKAKDVKVKKTAKILKITVSLKKINNQYLKGKKITLKFKGKKYTVKTNKKGIVTFKIKKNIIKKLKKGKRYTYQIIYLKDVVSKKIIVKK